MLYLMSPKMQNFLNIKTDFYSLKEDKQLSEEVGGDFAI